MNKHVVMLTASCVVGALMWWGFAEGVVAAHWWLM